MGVDSLWQLIEPSSTSITLDVLEGKRLAIGIKIYNFLLEWHILKLG